MMGNNTIMTSAQARSLISRLVGDLADVLVIDMDDFDAMHVLPEAEENGDPSPRACNGDGPPLRRSATSLESAGSPRLGGFVEYTAPDIMSILCGTVMESHIVEIQARRLNIVLNIKKFEEAIKKNTLEDLRVLFRAWATAKESAGMALWQAQSALEAAKIWRHQLPKLARREKEPAEEDQISWRLQEEMIRVCSKSVKEVLGIWNLSVSVVFKRWKEMVAEKGRGKQAAVETHEVPIGITHKDRSGAKVMKNVKVLEQLYETRVAQAERLLPSSSSSIGLCGPSRGSGSCPSTWTAASRVCASPPHQLLWLSSDPPQLRNSTWNWISPQFE
jgi:hypothetical protein